ncbi:MAG: hypothetical protein RL653_844 [Pseudomonadota bacterium]|jgi:hypothetical protein
MRPAPLLCLFLLSGCITVPRSAVLGMTASPLGAGRTEVGVSGGLAILSETEPPETRVSSGVTTSDWLTRAGASMQAEAHVHHGLSDWLGLNLHVSQAGIQPGLKITLLERVVTLALMPEVGFGLLAGQTGETQFVGSTRADGPPLAELRWLLVAGGRLLLSHPNTGVYFGVGYQFQLAGQNASQKDGTRELLSQSTTHTLHNVQAAFGWEVRAGNLRVRPEFAAVITPEWSTSTSSGGTQALRAGGNGFLLLPNVTFALVSDAPPRQPDEDEPPRRGGGRRERDRDRRPSDGGDDDDLDDPAFRR